MSAELKQAEVDRVMRNLTRVLEEIDTKKNKRTIMSRAASPVLKSAKQIAPIRDSKWPKVKPRWRKGSKEPVAWYWRGNLRRSIQLLSLKRAVRIILGPAIPDDPTGVFRGRKVDGYYAQMIYGSAKAFGERVMQKALSATQGQAISIASREIRNLVPKLAKKYGFTE